MHAAVPEVLWTKLMESADMGATTIVVEDNVDGKWNVGDEIAIASTSFIPGLVETGSCFDCYVILLQFKIECSPLA